MKRYACQALPSLLLAELGHIKRWRRKAIKGKDPEGVHQLRVSLRRMRSALKVFSPVLNPGYRRRWRSELKSLAKELDHVRDLDVFLETHYSTTKADSALESLLRKQKKQSQKKLAGQLRSKSFQKPCRKLKKQLKHKRWADRHCRNTSMLTTTLAGKQLQQRYEVILQQKSTLKLEDETALHQLRISIKQLRYGCELLAPVLKKKKNAAFIKAMKDLQDDLGLIHDASVQQAMLKDIPEAPRREFSQIAEASRNNSQQLKSTLAARLNTFSELPLPWAGLWIEPAND